MTARTAPPWCPTQTAAGLPKISIVTPNYNYAHFLGATLRSVLDQNYPNLEYLVLDDGSTDNSVAVIERYADRLAYWQAAPNQGQYKTITAGFARSTGDVMGWLNSDDMHLPWTLWAVADIFARFPEVEWITTLALGAWDYAGCCLGFSRNRGYARAAFLDGRYASTAHPDPQGVPGWAKEPIQQESTFWRRSVWEKAGGYVSAEFGSAGDFELWGRFFRHAELVGVSVPLAGFRLQHAQQTAQAAKYAAYAQQALDAHRREAGWRPPRTRFASYHGRLWSVPRVKTFLTRRFGYHGRRLVRADPSKPDAHWVLESHRFF